MPVGNNWATSSSETSSLKKLLQNILLRYQVNFHLHHHRLTTSSCHPLKHLLASGCTFVEVAAPSLDVVDEESTVNPSSFVTEETSGFRCNFQIHPHHLPGWCSRWSSGRRRSQLGGFQLPWGLVRVVRQRLPMADAGQSIKVSRSFDEGLATTAVRCHEVADGGEGSLSHLWCISYGRNLWFSHLENN